MIESNLNTLWGSLTVEELVRNGAGLFCLSPGSRCTPLTIAVADNPRAENVVHFDERGAAYYALGYAKATGKPAALICTSGTAAANYLPAVVEASLSCVPLVLLTADRPPELLDAGANQAIDQTKLFGDYVRWQTTLPCPDENVPPEMVLTTIDQAVYRATRSPAGPVHVNCMFREPLAPVADGRDLGAYRASIASWDSGDAPYTSYADPERTASPDSLRRVMEPIRATSRGILLVGQLGSTEEIEAVRRLSTMLNWPVFPDVASGLRLGSPNPPFIHYYDEMLLAPCVEEYGKPETVIQIGTPFTSKRLLQYFEKQAPKTYIMVADHPMRHDPAHRVTVRIDAGLAEFSKALATRLEQETSREDRSPAPSPWLERLSRDATIADATIGDFLTGHDELSEPAVARLISENLPESGALFLGNSMPVRDMDRYGSPGGNPVRVGVNRGASGIDGTLATALGCARGTGVPITVILGDMALLHDLNSLVLLAQSALPVTVIVVNNNGGGIFSFLPIAKCKDYMDRYFQARHDLRFRAAAEFAGLKFANPQSKNSFKEIYREYIKAGTPTLIEINADTEENVQIHRLIGAEIVSALEGAN